MVVRELDTGTLGCPKDTHGPHLPLGLRAAMVHAVKGATQAPCTHPSPCGSRLPDPGLPSPPRQ